MQPLRVTVIIPTLAADHALWECVECLQKQNYRNFQIVIVDNSGSRRVEASWPSGLSRPGVTVLHPGSNIGYGAAVNLAAREAPGDLVAVINDDAAAEPEWLAELVAAMERHPEAGSAASQVRQYGDEKALDSAGMVIGADGTSKQRGQGQAPGLFAREEEVLLPCGSASIYRSKMLAETGGFDDSYFLYCEDTDLGLRARWAGWSCIYVPSAVVRHRYSHSAGRASWLKAYFVERNRLLTIVKNFPPGRLLWAFAATPWRYVQHLLAMRQGKGAAGQFRQNGSGVFTLAACVIRAHGSALLRLPHVWRQRREIRRSARITARAFGAALDRHAISLREVAEL